MSPDTQGKVSIDQLSPSANECPCQRLYRVHLLDIYCIYINVTNISLANTWQRICSPAADTAITPLMIWFEHVYLFTIFSLASPFYIGSLSCYIFKRSIITNVWEIYPTSRRCDNLCLRLINFCFVKARQLSSLYNRALTN